MNSTDSRIVFFHYNDDINSIHTTTVTNFCSVCFKELKEEEQHDEKDHNSIDIS